MSNDALPENITLEIAEVDYISHKRFDVYLSQKIDYISRTFLKKRGDL